MAACCESATGPSNGKSCRLFGLLAGREKVPEFSHLYLHLSMTVFIDLLQSPLQPLQFRLPFPLQPANGLRHSAADHGCAKLVEWSGGATGLDQWLPSYQPFRASWQTALGSCRRFLRPLYSFRTAGFPQYGWKPALSSCALPKPFGASFDAGAVVRPFPAISYPGAWDNGCTHRPLAQRGLSCPHLQSLLRPDPPV